MSKRPSQNPISLALGLDRHRTQTLREQARQAIAEAIRVSRPGFRLGERLTTSRLSRHNPIHRNTLTLAMDDLVRLGYLRRVPNRGFEIVAREPERPALLTRHMLSISEVAHRHGLEGRSRLIPEECGLRRAGAFRGELTRVRRDLGLEPSRHVWMLTRCRDMRRPGQHTWSTVAIEQSFVPSDLFPDFLDAAQRAIRRQEDFSVYGYLRGALPRDDFFKAHYEISLAPLPEDLLPHWTCHASPMNVLTVTYSSVGPIELTHTWFDTRRAVLLAGSLDVIVK